MSSKPLLRWIHLSDLNFGHGSDRDQYTQQGVREALIRDAKAMVKEIDSPDAIFITGNIASSANKAQYGDAHAFLTKLHEAIGVGPEKVFLVPGSRDVDMGTATSTLTMRTINSQLGKTPEDLDAFIANPADLKNTLWPKLETYAHFSATFGSGRLSPENPFWVQPLREGSSPIVAVGLNTSLLSFRDKGVPKDLAIGMGQLHRAFKDLPSDALFIVLMHHHPSGLSDGSNLDALLKLRPHLQLCGPDSSGSSIVTYTMDDGGICRFALGAGHAGQKEEGKYAYAWGAFSFDGIRFWPRIYNDGVSEFQENATSYSLGDKKYHLVGRGRTTPPMAKWLAANFPHSTPIEVVEEAVGDSPESPALKRQTALLARKLAENLRALLIQNSSCRGLFYLIYQGYNYAERDLEQSEFVNRELNDGECDYTESTREILLNAIQNFRDLRQGRDKPLRIVAFSEFLLRQLALYPDSFIDMSWTSDLQMELKSWLDDCKTVQSGGMVRSTFSKLENSVIQMFFEDTSNCLSLSVWRCQPNAAPLPLGINETWSDDFSERSEILRKIVSLASGSGTKRVEIFIPLQRLFTSEEFLEYQDSLSGARESIELHVPVVLRLNPPKSALVMRHNNLLNRWSAIIPTTKILQSSSTGDRSKESVSEGCCRPLFSESNQSTPRLDDAIAMCFLRRHVQNPGSGPSSAFSLAYRSGVPMLLWLQRVEEEEKVERKHLTTFVNNLTIQEVGKFLHIRFKEKGSPNVTVLLDDPRYLRPPPLKRFENPTTR